ncbi:hypothetical protein [Streptomyces sp. NBC_01614]|uniref:hypothetical protein n=1 Tax=Streptomyces sp. NBC_01614 TaxID=2975897 RepID=UPI00386598D1
MNPDLYDAWLTAGNTLQPAGDWLVANWVGLTGLIAGAVLAVWAIRRHISSGHDAHRTRDDRVMARRYARYRPTLEQQQPGSDHQLYLDCIAVYGEHPGIDRLLNDIRKEKP